MNENLEREQKLKDLIIRLLEDQEGVKITVLETEQKTKDKTA